MCKKQKKKSQFQAGKEIIETVLHFTTSSRAESLKLLYFNTTAHPGRWRERLAIHDQKWWYLCHALYVLLVKWTSLWWSLRIKTKRLRSLRVIASSPACLDALNPIILSILTNSHASQFSSTAQDIKVLQVWITWRFKVTFPFFPVQTGNLKPCQQT